MKKNKVLCLCCGNEVDVYYDKIDSQIEYKGQKIKYKEKVAYCKECNAMVDVPNLWDENLREIQHNYCVLNNRCSIVDLEKILQKYNIGKEPLAKMLGWGAATIKRYFNGMLPSKMYSDEIKKLLNSPVYFEKRLLESKNQTKTKLSNITYRKVMNQIKKILDESEDVSIQVFTSITKTSIDFRKNNYLEFAI